VTKRLLDTDTLIEFFRKNPAVVSRTAEYLQEHEQLSIAIVTYYEVLRGLRYVNVEKQLQALESFVADNEIVPLDINAVQKAAEVYAALRTHGKLISEGDILIAGIALANNYVLVTNNTGPTIGCPACKSRIGWPRMTKNEMARRNFEYVELFTKEVLDDERFARRIPKGASVFFLPDNDPELCAANRKLAERAKKQGKKVVLVRIELVPKITFVPRLTVSRLPRATAN